MPKAPSLENPNGLTYRQSGVDIAAGDDFVKAITPLIASTSRPGTGSKIGGFAGLFDLKSAGYIDPILVAATDGVGTKLKFASKTQQHHTVGIDLVAMCVNDIVVQGAEPLFFLDYYATGKLEPEIAHDVVSGIVEGCKQAGCALIGGETAEMPGMYAQGDYDLAGFAVGAAERGTLLPSHNIAEGDVILALGSSGVHSNGFSLVRAIVDQAGADLAGPSPFAPGQNLAQSLLIPTKIYVRPILDVRSKTRAIEAIAHITGGGISGNLSRVLPDHLSATVNLSALPRLEVFGWLAKIGGIKPSEMLATFNCGAGMIIIVKRTDIPIVLDGFQKAGERAVEIGVIKERGRSDPVVFNGQLWWAA